MFSSDSPRPLRIGLTGGVASGKTTVADYFADLGVPVIDTDVIAREVVVRGAPTLRDIRRAFGDGVFNDDGSLDRKEMRKVVFADSDKRAKLESILHPLIRKSTELQARQITYPYMIIVIPLLVESSLKNFVDRVLVVDCSEDVQLQRLKERDMEDTEQARRMIAAQSSREDRLAIAHDVIDNDGDLAETRASVARFHQQYLDMSRSGGYESSSVIA